MGTLKLTEIHLHRVMRGRIIDWRTGCWTTDRVKRRDGYQQITVLQEQHYQHRLAYRLLVGEIPEGMEIDHLCRNKGCFNPDHLEPVTREENVARAAPYRRVKTHCKHGHALSGDNVYVVERKNKKGERRCRECHRERNRRYKAEAKEGV